MLNSLSSFVIRNLCPVLHNIGDTRRVKTPWKAHPISVRVCVLPQAQLWSQYRSSA